MKPEEQFKHFWKVEIINQQTVNKHLPVETVFISFFFFQKHNRSSTYVLLDSAHPTPLPQIKQVQIQNVNY